MVISPPQLFFYLLPKKPPLIGDSAIETLPMTDFCSIWLNVDFTGVVSTDTSPMTETASLYFSRQQTTVSEDRNAWGAVAVANRWPVASLSPAGFYRHRSHELWSERQCASRRAVSAPRVTSTCHCLVATTCLCCSPLAAAIRPTFR